jgi:glucan-binding YG repeat protein
VGQIDPSAGEKGGSWSRDAANNWHYSHADGSAARSEWALISDGGRANWYAFDENGAMRTGWFVSDGQTYYLETTPDATQGAMAIGWKQIDGRWYYFEIIAGDRQGRMYRGEQTPDGYRVGEDGGWDGSPAQAVTGR